MRHFVFSLRWKCKQNSQYVNKTDPGVYILIVLLTNPLKWKNKMSQIDPKSLWGFHNDMNKYHTKFQNFLCSKSFEFTLPKFRVSLYERHCNFFSIWPVSCRWVTVTLPGKGLALKFQCVWQFWEVALFIYFQCRNQKEKSAIFRNFHFSKEVLILKCECFSGRSFENEWESINTVLSFVHCNYRKSRI